MKKGIPVILLLSFFFLFPSWVQSQPDKFFERLLGPMLQPSDLKILQLEMVPHPVRESEWVNFQTVVSNHSRHPGKVSLFIKDRDNGGPLRVGLRIQDRDQVVTRLEDVLLRPGYSEFLFPYIRYPFQGFDHCFAVIADVERTPYRMDPAKEFCAKPYGWSLRP